MGKLRIDVFSRMEKLRNSSWENKIVFQHAYASKKDFGGKYTI